jgi:hypothetical protein
MKGRGQAALDYISTYGWALIALSAVIGALYLFVDFNPSNTIADTCSFGVGDSFYCVDAQINRTTGVINMSLKNTLGSEINVSYVICTHKEVRVSDNNNLISIAPSSSFYVYCNMTNTGMTFDKKTKVDVTVVYTKKDSAYPFSVEGSVTSQPMK